MSTETTGVTNDLSVDVAAEIRAWMGRRSVRQSHLARQLGENEQWLSMRLRGITPLNINDIGRIASALGVEVIDLLPRNRRTPTLTFVDPPVDHVARRPFRNSAPTGGRPSNRADRNGSPPGPRRAVFGSRRLSA